MAAVNEVRNNEPVLFVARPSRRGERSSSRLVCSKIQAEIFLITPGKFLNVLAQFSPSKLRYQISAESAIQPVSFNNFFSS